MEKEKFEYLLSANDVELVALRNELKNDDTFFGAATVSSDFFAIVKI